MTAEWLASWISSRECAAQLSAFARQRNDRVSLLAGSSETSTMAESCRS
jgi:hypothetical protein